jgi:hypothetical protein
LFSDSSREIWKKLAGPLGRGFFGGFDEKGEGTKKKPGTFFDDVLGLQKRLIS